MTDVYSTILWKLFPIIPAAAFFPLYPSGPTWLWHLAQLGIMLCRHSFAMERRVPKLMAIVAKGIHTSHSCLKSIS